MHYRDAIFSCHGSTKGLSVYSQFDEYICRFESCSLDCPLAEVNVYIVTGHPCRPPVSQATWMDSSIFFAL